MSTTISARGSEDEDSGFFVDDIQSKANGVVAFYFTGRELWNPARGLTAALIQSVAEYETRFLIELVQNGYDALRGEPPGRIQVLLDEDERENGVLYVANDGKPFTKSNFHSICEFAQSDKQPGQSVGNKGIGFKSVLAVSTEPEIYSAAQHPNPDRFGGYCFRFATPDDMLRLVDDNTTKAEELARDVSPYFLPIPLADQPARVGEFAAQGYATVIRLPLEDEQALSVARSEVGKLRGSGAPIHLFLSGLSSLEISTEPRDGAEEPALTRNATVRYATEGTVIEEIDLGPHGRWLVTTVEVPDEDLRRALIESVDARMLDPRWPKEWSSEASVSAAVRIDGGPVISRYYTYLPMGDDCSAPFRGCIHAPFTTKLARTELREEVPLNRLFLDVSARCIVEALRYVVRDGVDLPQETGVDLLAWDVPKAERLITAMRTYDLDPLTSPLIPAAEKRAAPSRVGLGEIYSWDDSRLELSSKRLMSCTAARFLPPLEQHRVDRLDKLAQYLGRPAGLKPDSNTMANWAEAVAAQLAGRKFRRHVWEGFYEDLAQLFAEDAETLRDRKIIIGDDGILHKCAPRGAEEVNRPIVFFPAAREAGDTEDDPLLDVRVPRQLKRRIAWVKRDLRWLDGARRNTAGRQFLEGKRLVRPFDRRSLVEQIGRVMKGAKSEATFSEVLNFAYVLHSGSTGGRLDFRSVRLRVPTTGGWAPTADSYFPATWLESSGGALEKLIDTAASVSPEIAAIGHRLLLPPDRFPGEASERRAWARFLREAGVRVGLTPVALERRKFRYEAREVSPQSIGKRLGLSASAIDAWAAAHTDEGAQRPEGYTKDYATRDNIWRLPAADDYNRFNQEARVAFAAVVVHSAAAWSDHHWRVNFFRPDYATEPGAEWPSPMSAFLSQTAWLPIHEPTDQDAPHFERPGGAWHFQSSARDEPPAYAPMVLHSLRGLIDSQPAVSARLRKLGLRIWNEESDTGARLLFLGRLLHEKRIPAKPPNTFLKAYRETLATAATAAGQNPFALGSSNERYVIVSRSGTAVAIRAEDDDGSPIYVAERGRKLSSRIVQLLPVDVVWVDRAEAPVAAMLNEALGSAVRQASQASVELRVDGVRFLPRPSDPRLVEGRDWLVLLLALMLDLKESAFEHRGERAQREVLDRLRALRLREAGEIRLTIDELDVTLPKHMSSTYPHSDPAGPYLIIDAGSAVELGIDDLEAMAPSLADALGVGTLDGDLSLAFIRLGRQMASIADAPSDAAFAKAFDTSEDYVRQIRADLAGESRLTARLLLPLVVLLLGEGARPISDTRGRLSDAAAIREFLEEHAEQLPRSPEDLMELCARIGNLDQLRIELELDFAQLNAVLAELGEPYAPIRHPRAHEQAMSWYLAEHRESLLGALRARFLSAFESGASLKVYLELKSFPGLESDPTWLDQVPMPTSDMLSEQATRWLTMNGIPVLAGTPLQPIDELQAANRRLVEKDASNLKLLIAAWTAKYRHVLPAGLDEPSWAHDYAGDLSSTGSFDFRLLDTKWVVGRLVADGIWPSDMPRETDLEQLGLTEVELRNSENTDQEERARKERAKRTVTLDGVAFAADEDQLAALAAAVAESVTEGFLQTPRKQARLDEPLTPPKGGSGGTGGKRGGNQPTDAQKRAIGLAGESAVFEWLKGQYPGLDAATWKSAYRDLVFGGTLGNDDLGYDFEVHLPNKRVLYEVKSTQSADLLEFSLGESQVRAAQEAAAHPRRAEFWIVYVRNVLVSAERSLNLLPNPFTRDGARFLRNVGRGLIYRFTLRE